MSRTEAEMWSAGSVIATPVYHATTRTATDSIKQHGFDLIYRAGGRAWGDGVYATADADVLRWYLAQLGARVVALELRLNVRRLLSVRVRSSHGLPMFQVLAVLPDGLARFIVATITESSRAAALTRLLTTEGYDALEILEDPFTPIVGGNQLVVFDPRRVVVVSDDDSDRT